MLKDSPIILLDEATASLDPENELYIQQAIDGLLQNKTVVIIAHRLNTVVNADKIIVLDKGRIVEEGKHNDLIKNKGLYYRMWEEQRKTHSWKF
jgi:ATP-binding cassette subfamily B protein